MNTQIKCPYCNKSFEPTDAYKHELEERLLKEAQLKHQEEIEQLKREKREISESKEKEVKEAKRKARESVREEVEERVKQELSEKGKQNAKLQEQLKEQSQLLAELREEKSKLRTTHKQELEEVKQKTVQKARLEAQESITKELKDKEDQIAELKKRAEQAEEQELKIRKEKRELEESKRKFELEKQRQLDEEREKIRIDAKKETEDKMSLTLAQEKKKNEDAQKQILELQRKLQQGSQQAQGEVMELEIEELLRKEFPLDAIEEVKKGQRGADIIHKVIDKKGQMVGTLLWESKNGKWHPSWIKKLKEDQRQAKADLAILVSNNLPPEIKDSTYRDGIWILARKMIIPIALTLRFSLIKVNFERGVNTNKNEKMAVLYQYMTSVEFKHRIEAIIESFTELQEEMEKEKRFFNTKWAKQEKSLRKVIDHTHGMYGELQAIAGKSLPEIKSLQLEAGEK